MPITRSKEEKSIDSFSAMTNESVVSYFSEQLKAQEKVIEMLKERIEKQEQEIESLKSEILSIKEMMSTL